MSSIKPNGKISSSEFSGSWFKGCLFLFLCQRKPMNDFVTDQSRFKLFTVFSCLSILGSIYTLFQTGIPIYISIIAIFLLILVFAPSLFTNTKDANLASVVFITILTLIFYSLIIIGTIWNLVEYQRNISNQQFLDSSLSKF